MKPTFTQGSNPTLSYLPSPDVFLIECALHATCKRRDRIPAAGAMNQPRRQFLRRLAAAAAGAVVPVALPMSSTASRQTPAAGGPVPTAERPFQAGGQLFASNQFQQALEALAEGGVLLVRGGASYHVTGTLRRNNVTIRAVGGKATFDGLGDPAFPAQGKALIVQQGNAVTFEGLVFRNVAVPDDNGAGVRVEGTGMTIFRRCEFRDSQEGILTRNDPNLHLTLEDCIGDNLGDGVGQSHGVYCGVAGSLTVKGGEWTNSNVGHLLKSRAARTRIESVRLVEGRASRAIDIPNGGEVEIVGCVISQAQDTNNPQLIGYGLEVSTPTWPVNSFLFRASNNITDTRNPRGAVFGFAAWFTDKKTIERYTYNGSTANPPGMTVR